MAKRRKKKGRRRSYKKRSAPKRAPKTLKGVWKQQPLLVKGGIAVSALEMLSDKDYGGIALSTRIVNLAKKQDSLDNVMAASKEAIMSPDNYIPIVVGVIGHKAAKMLGVKGL